MGYAFSEADASRIAYSIRRIYWQSTQLQPGADLWPDWDARDFSAATAMFKRRSRSSMWASVSGVEDEEQGADARLLWFLLLFIGLKRSKASDHLVSFHSATGIRDQDGSVGAVILSAKLCDGIDAA